ncbi:MAG: cell division protein FtsZ [Pseudomonadota bacterium]|nr:cell division protein FtsZ [Pseudomonadota bacterium]
MIVEEDNFNPPGAKIKIVGIGGGGGNAINTMIQNNLQGLEFVVINTDMQSLKHSLAQTKIQIGKELTKGFGAGANPDIGRDAALEDRHELQEVLADADMIFITAGMGGGTGTGGASIVAQIAKELGTLTVAVVTTPFAFEGKRRKRHADIGIERLREHVDTLITIPNQRLLTVSDENISLIDAFKIADGVLVNAVRGISDIINVPGTINVDFADAKTVMSSMGQAVMGIGVAAGERRATLASKQAISSPLLEEINIEGATGILINITAGANITLKELHESCSIVQDAAHEDANIIFGAVIDETMGDEIRVTLIATGFPVDSLSDNQGKRSPLQPMSNNSYNRKLPINRRRSGDDTKATQPAVPAPMPQSLTPTTHQPPTPAVSQSSDQTVSQPPSHTSVQNEQQEDPPPPAPQTATSDYSPYATSEVRPPATEPSVPHTEQPSSAGNIAHDIDSSIDEAIKLAKKSSNLDVPAFMRTGKKELPSSQL